MDEDRPADDDVMADELPAGMRQHAAATPGHLVPDLIHQDTYTVQEVASLLGMSVDMIRHAVQSGDLQADRAGHEIVCIHRDALSAWLQARGPGL